MRSSLRMAGVVVALLLIAAGPVRAQLTTTQLLDTLQHTAFNFFWNEANPANGLIKDRSASGAPSSIASVGFGLTAICIGVDHGWVARPAARDRVLTTLKTFWNGPQGSGATGFIGNKGFFFHFLDMSTATRTWNSELSTIDTALLFAGMLYVREYFDGTDSTEVQIRALADSIYARADWEWFRNFNPGLLLGWMPGTNFTGYGEWFGYNEAMIMHILGYGSPTHPITTVPGDAWKAWTSKYQVGTIYGQTYVLFAPLFGHQYSHCWIDFRNIRDEYMRNLGWDYFENSRRAALAQRAYCAANPGGWVGYSDTLWGITACDGPNGYRARGAPGPGTYDDGTIAPTAAISSIVFAPEIVLPTIQNLWNNYRAELWTQYGFRDAFNLTQSWWGPDVIGIDQGPIIIMIENYRNGAVWARFMRNANIRRGLERIGFAPLTPVKEDPGGPSLFTLAQNYPNPFNSSTNIQFELPRRSHVTLRVFDMLGRERAVLVDEIREPGSYAEIWHADDFSSGVYFYRLDVSMAEQTGSMTETKRLILLK